MVLDTDSVISPSLSFLEGAIIPLASQFESRTCLAKLILEAMESVGFPGNRPLFDMTEEQKRILNFLSGKTEGDVREAFGAVGQVSNLSKEIEGLKSSLKDMVGRVEQLEADAKANNELIISWQGKYSNANSKVSKLEAEIKVQSDEKNQWKNRYEAALKEQVNKYKPIELIVLGIRGLLKK
jgi:flagellar biosynthesis chaperone FliJ